VFPLLRSFVPLLASHQPIPVWIPPPLMSPLDKRPQNQSPSQPPPGSNYLGRGRSFFFSPSPGVPRWAGYLFLRALALTLTLRKIHFPRFPPPLATNFHTPRLRGAPLGMFRFLPLYPTFYLLSRTCRAWFLLFGATSSTRPREAPLFFSLLPPRPRGVFFVFSISQSLAYPVPAFPPSRGFFVRP